MATQQRLKDVSYVKVDFTPDPGFELNFDGVTGTEELGRPFLFQLAMTAGELKGNVQNLIGSTASIKFMAQSRQQQGEDSKDHYINAIVTRVVSEGLARGSYHYTIELRPWIWLLTRVEDCKIFQNTAPFDIVTKVFRDAGFSDFQDSRQNAAGSTVLDYCVQYRESSFDFVTRLMEEFGFYYFFKHESSKHTLVFADDSNAHTELPKGIPFQFDTTEHRTVEDHAWEWTSEYALHSGKYTFRDYNFTTPTLDLTSKSINPATHQHASFEVYEYPGLYDQSGLGQTLADLRMQAIAADRALFQGVSNSRELHAGWRFKLEKHKDSAMNRGYLIVRSEITTNIAEGMSTKENEGEKLDTYRVTLHAIPGDVPFRLHRKTKRPMIRGPQTAKVVGPSGDEIYTDQYGRVKVKFHWDRADSSDEDRTCWIRVAQAWAGAGWGSIIIPRVGMEVVIEFLEGNPDRPLITGVVYNANQTVPYALPGDKTKSTLKTNSSTGGSGFNELRFEDKAGSEEVFFQAQKDYNKKVLNNETVSIKKDTTTTVEEGNRSVTVSQGNDSITVSTGNHSITVSAGKSDVTAATSITLTSGASTIKISPTGVEITAPQVKVTATATMSLQASASMTVNGGASLSLTAGMISIN
jgi:type VI secretion system secreted protein VgrG